ncbi:DUF1003 domain-containing protein [bacterium]|nr:MAG: DUF1003 domain-containing protein [bacterium]
MSVRTSDSGNKALKHILRTRKLKAVDHRHPVNQVHHDEATLGERVADKAAAGIGSWTFLIIQTVAVACWVSLNVVGFVSHWDAFPFILLNLLFSVQAAYTGPVLLLAGNRQSQKDRLTLEHAAEEAEKADVQNVEILKAIEKNTELTLTILRHVEALVTDSLAQPKG